MTKVFVVPTHLLGTITQSHQFKLYIRLVLRGIQVVSSKPYHRLAALLRGKSALCGPIVIRRTKYGHVASKPKVSWSPLRLRGAGHAPLYLSLKVPNVTFHDRYFNVQLHVRHRGTG